jgi:FkbM family methyltransferase
MMEPLGMKMSYAQNLEDYHLDLIFAGQADGTYVDVGGGHPVADNVSFWFYLKGWRGLVVEPQAQLATAYTGIRPRDTVYGGLAGRSEGSIDFHVVEGLHGLSSAVKANAESARQYGAVYRTETKPVSRLSKLIDEAGLAAIDFLKIDVEGSEADVVAGLDLTRHRPRVILVEAVNPNSPPEQVQVAIAAWEPILVAGGYTFAFFDNLNRFYVADEHTALKARFPENPTPWDRVTHLWDCGRAADKPGHPDHALAHALVTGLMAALPGLDPDLLARLIARGKSLEKSLASTELAALLRGTAEFPRAAGIEDGDIAGLLQSDQVRAALGRIACMYDGGHLLE